MVATLKFLLKLNRRTSRASRGLTVEAGERQIGGAGHMQRDPNNVTEEQITPTHAYDERYGAAISTFWSYFIRNLIVDPTTKQPGIMTINPDAIDDRWQTCTALPGCTLNQIRYVVKLSTLGW